MTGKNIRKKLNILLVTVFLLLSGLAVTSFALTSSVITLRNHHFSMSTGVELEINDGSPVIDGSDVLYEPGGSYQREFSIANPGVIDIWYRIYITDAEGAFKENITVTIKEPGGTVLCHGRMDELSAETAAVASLGAKEEKILSIELYFAPDAENGAQGKEVSFTIAADATQKKNNPMGLFE